MKKKNIKKYDFGFFQGFHALWFLKLYHWFKIQLSTQMKINREVVFGFHVHRNVYLVLTHNLAYVFCLILIEEGIKSYLILLGCYTRFSCTLIILEAG